MQPIESAILSLCESAEGPLHSKNGLSQYILSLSNQNSETLRIKEDIARLSYTSKVIGVKGTEVGIVSKRVMMESRENKSIDRNSLNQNSIKHNPFPTNNFIVHKNFFVNPLSTGKKEQRPKSTQAIKSRPLLLPVSTSHRNEYVEATPYKTNSGFKPRTKSMAKLKMWEAESHRNSKQTLKLSEDRKRMDSKFKVEKVKSFSNLLKDLRSSKSLILNPIEHEENSLFRLYERICLTTIDPKPEESEI